MSGKAEQAFLVLVVVLFSPLFIVVADRGLSLRDLLLVVYLSYVVLGGAAAGVVDWGKRQSQELRQSWPHLAGVAAVLTAAAGVAFTGLGHIERQPASTLDNWDNSVAHDTAAWIAANVPAGTPIMSTRLYFSQVYFLDGGRYPISQLPTVEVRLDFSAPTPLHRRSTLFRFEPTRLHSDSTDDRWLYLTRYPEKDYYLGLAESDLLAELGARGARYLVLNVSDGGFSSQSFQPYFDANSAFALVYSRSTSPMESTRIYSVNLDALEPIPEPARVTRSAYEALARELGEDASLAAFFGRLNSAGVIETKY